MTITPFDAAAGHQYFSADYFNRVWDLLDKKDRTREEAEQMISMCHASLAHWCDREDCAAQQLSVAYWQLSRVYSAVKKGTPARRYALMCLDVSADEPPFYLGFAHEAMSRAARLKQDPATAADHLTKAREQLELIEDEDSKRMLAADLDELKQ